MIYTVQLPLSYSSRANYTSIDTVKDFIKQNVKNLLLTAPGERVMIPDFGVGLRDFLFENGNQEITQEIIERINYQFDFFLPDVTILSITTDLIEQQLIVKLVYSYTPYNLTDTIQLKI